VAIAYDQTIKLRIEAEATGAHEVDKLANEIEALGQQGATAAPRFLELANEVRNLGQQQVRITGLESAIASAKQTWTAVSDARREVQSLDKALADAKGAGANRDAIKLLEGALRTANRELASSEKAWGRQKDVLNSTRQAAADAGVDTKALASEQARLAVALDGASQALTEQKVALSAQQAAAKSQAAEEDRLAQIVETSKTRQKLAAQELLAVEKKAYSEAEAAASRAATQRAAEAKAVEDFSTRTKKALADAFSSTGVRSTAAIQSDILQVNQSLLKLASNAKVSGADFDRAFAAGQARIATLRAEMDGTGAASAKLEASTKTLAGEFKGLVAQLGGVYVAFQAGGMFVAANSQAETFARTMTLLTGSSEKAAAEMEYVRGAANRLGLEVQTASKSYTQLVAATKGTAMEGESARKVFEAVSGAMASLGKSSSETNDALRAVNQMASKGTVQMEELKGQLGEALPGAMKAAANGAGLTVAELTKMVETGGVLAEDLLPALANGLNEMYKTGTTNNDTFVANWARLKNAITDTFQVIGDTGLFRALVVVVEQVGIAIGGLTGAFVLLGKTFGITAGAIATFDWKHPIDSMVRWRDSVSQAADEIQKNLDKQKAAAQGAADKQKEAADAVEASGQKASAAAGNWLQIENAYTKASDTSKKYIENLKTLQAARDSEAAAMKAYADTYGTEKEKLEASSNAALEHEKALRALSEQVNADLEISKAKLASLEAERRVDGSLTEAKEKLREELQKTIVAKQAEADKTLQATSAAHSATLQAEASASVYADHAKQIYALRDAYQAAESEYQRLAALNATGVNVAKELKTADEARAKALLLYRDALSDATAAAERHAVAERNAASLQQSALQNDLYRANTILEIAKQRGNEKEIAQAQIAVWRIELEISEAQAQASRLEAEAMLIVAKAKRAELEASGALTEAKKAELAVMDANIKAKQLEADKYDLIAARMKALSYETKELKSSFFDLSSSADDAASAADRAATSYDGLTTSIRGAAAAKDGFTRDASGNVLEVASVTPQTVATRLKNLGVSDALAAQQARQFFDAAGNTQNTYGLSLDAAVQALADRLTGKGVQSSSMNIVRVDLTTNRGTSSVKVASPADAAALVSTLQELAARS
jgi:tape measure domain-containing protein